MKAPAGLKVSYSGIRGIYPLSLTPKVAYGFGKAFVELLSKKSKNPLILVGRDTRDSGEELENAMISGILSAPCCIQSLGIVATPTIQQALSDFSAHGGVIITASHNPPEWNGFKFFKAPNYTVLSPLEMKKLFELYQILDSHVKLSLPVLPYQSNSHRAINLHLEKVLAYVDVDLIRDQHFVVELDSAGGTGELLGSRLLEKLGCEVEILRSGRSSEPIPQNLTQLCEVVKNRRADLGLAQDLDADRLAVVSEQGIAVGEEYTLALVVRHLLEKFKTQHPVVVKNSSTSHLINYLVEQFGAQMVETKVGEINLSLALKKYLDERRLAFGGEGNGGVIFPPISLGRDSFIGMAFILEYLALRKKPVSELIAEFPPFHQAKIKIPLKLGENPEQYFKQLIKAFPEVEKNTIDGLKLIFSNDTWLSLRSSNTEPIMRLTAESPTPMNAQALLKKAGKILGV